MQDMRIYLIRKSVALRISTCILSVCGVASAAPETDELASIGQALFFDTNLSANRTQSCATCHEPGNAFSDGRASDVLGAVSLGDDGESLGDRNTPGTTYAFLIPEFHRNDKGEYVGGYFLDGRAETMTDQAAEPFVNPLEMALPDHQALVERVLENSFYEESLKEHFGDDVFSNTESALNAITESIVAFERSDVFAPFDSKYDRFLRGQYELTWQEEKGRQLFFAQLINCHNCHLLDTREMEEGELFSNHQYHNIGLPTNHRVREKNSVDADHQDLGLLENPAVDDPAMAGKFRVPSLRNVAVTAPYMHNGVFQDLRTAILFYNKFTLSNPQSQTNPETGELWGDAEVPENIDLDLLRDGQPIAENHVELLIAFLRALTDQRYESLLDEPAPD